jgi:hypothetical protein
MCRPPHIYPNAFVLQLQMTGDREQNQNYEHEYKNIHGATSSV